MSTVIERLEEVGYKPNDKLLRELLKLTKNSSKVQGAVHGGYFSVLLNRAIERGVKQAHQELYPIVKEECTSEDMTAKERNAATNFARSAYSTLLKAERNGIMLQPGWTKQQYTDAIHGLDTKASLTTVMEKVLKHISDLKYFVDRGQITKQDIVNLVNSTL